MCGSAPAGDTRKTLRRAALLALTLVLVAAPAPSQSGTCAACEDFAAAASSSTSVLDAIARRNIDMTRPLLESDRGKLGDFYAACMDSAAIERGGTEALGPILGAVDAISGEPTLTHALAAMDSIGVDALWEAGSEVDARGGPRIVPFVAPPDDAGGEGTFVSLATLQERVPEIDWDRYFRERGFPAFAEIDMVNPKYFTTLQAALQHATVGQLKADLHDRALAAFAPWLPEGLGGERTSEPRWERCVIAVDSGFRDELGQAWVARALSPDAKARAKAMVASIAAALRADLENVVWLSAASRTEALAKLDRMTFAIGYPDRWPEESNAVIVRGDFLGDLLRARRARIAREIARIGQPLDRDAFGLSLEAVNAYYAPLRNEIVVPAGILQPPLFAADVAADYGGIGAVIGHEMTHAFDETGRLYDATGTQRDWWTPDTAAAFEARAACVTRQFAGFSLDGARVRNEAVADLGGLELAYRAFRKSGADSGKGAEQRFFRAFARMWSGSSTATEADPHPPNHDRVDGTVQNMPQFAAAFGCAPGDAMVRSAAERCSVW